MNDINKIRTLYKFKSTYRYNSQDKRKESSAEHTWSALMLADYILTKTKLKLNRVKVYELLIYHDVVEIEAGDTPIHHEHKKKDKKQREAKALKKLKIQLPTFTANKLESLFEEFELNQTPEAKFAHAIDKLDAIIHELDYKKDWKGWTEAMVRKYSETAASAFPETKKLFETLLTFIRENNYYH